MGTTLSLLPDLEQSAWNLLDSPQVTMAQANAYDRAGRALIDAYDAQVFHLTFELYGAAGRLVGALCESQGIHQSELPEWRPTVYQLTGLFPPDQKRWMNTALELAVDHFIAPENPKVNARFTQWGISQPVDGLEILISMVWLEQGFKIGKIKLSVPAADAEPAVA